MPKKKHFKVERHPPHEWRIVNAHIGHGLIFRTYDEAAINARILNERFEAWLASDKKLNTLPKRGT